MSKKSVRLLLVEDSPLDVEAFRRGLVKQRIGNALQVASNGAEALALLREAQQADKLDPPYLIFVDLNMPVMSGLEFLDALRSDDILQRMVVFVLTTSDDDLDKYSAYEKQVAGYILKQNLDTCFEDVFRIVDAYWKVVELPDGRNHE